MIAPATPLAVLLIIPGTRECGGVQVTARLTAEGLSAWVNAEGRRGPGTSSASHEPRQIGIFSYGDESAGMEGDEPSQGVPRARHASSRLQAVVQALRWNMEADLVLVWHLDLLKLRPFLRLRGATTVLFLHGIEAWRPLGRVNRLLARRVRLFLTNSDFTWRRCLEVNPFLAGARQTTMHLGVGAPLDHEPPAPAACAALMLSRLDSRENYKGHKELIDAWPLVLGQIPDAQLWIAGEGDLRSELERRVGALGLQRRVRFFGRVSESQKEELLGRARCLALPSRAEGFGLVYLEAMRLGRPCLVSTLDAGREVVNPPDAGLAADPDNPRDLAETIRRLLTPGQEWDAWSRQARARYEAGYTSRHFLDRLGSALDPLRPAARRADAM
jgi:phosphatidylinositol alpha-1,6-mannosyltransferase